MSLAPMHRAVLIMSLIAAGCGGRATPKPAPSNVAAPDAASDPATTDGEHCYPYLRRGDGSCPTECATRDDCAGSRGPADLAEHGWPLDCIQSECVPLSPDHVYGSGG